MIPRFILSHQDQPVARDAGQIFDSNILNPGTTFTHNFVQYGTFPYHCTLHPQMVGTVVVL